MYKYLYGKWKYLKGLIEGDGGIRLCDIRHYVRLENENMQDDEEVKHFEFPPESYQFSINNIDLDSKDFVGQIKFDIFVRPCLCICFSNKKNDSELFEKFEADVCIEFNVNCLIEFLKYIFETQFKGEVIAKNVYYYTDNAGLGTLSSQDAVFAKSIKYEHEDEFRIAVFLPYDYETLITVNGKKFKAFNKCECKLKTIKNGECHCYFSLLHNGLADGFKSYIRDVKKNN
ncbi:hypothetical protein [Xenorhabdus budapestensis]|uniref:Uncharacterized protein n=1 Tax=Xenorhabdus budapestensis TaxID=290110 RepID=A0A2D0J002_XENBU|nr:hypothetical protein [Xenorhabdus budapestensis]PHM27492.1 hypothetical protein Xbud_02349 [Xenorhabdus budapestensis]